jgi:16S rRNA (cytosine1407-C5)-methyltransferase
MENFKPTDSHPMREISQAERLRLQERQIQLLKSGLSALKIGGQLVYATCSLAPEEDEVVLDALISKLPDTFRVENVTNKIKIAAPGLLEFGSHKFHPDVNNALRIWPHRTGMSGFFCALITKLMPFQISPTDPPRREFGRTGLIAADRKTQEQVAEQLKAQFGFSLEIILTEFKLDVYRRKDQLFLIPQQYLEDFISLPYEYIGMPLGRWLGETLEPSHEFISRFGHTFSVGKIVLPENLFSHWISGRDIRNPDFPLRPEGQYVLVSDAFKRNLGLGKHLPNRLRNMLPR